jgi:penicillin-binding protein 2
MGWRDFDGPQVREQRAELVQRVRVLTGVMVTLMLLVMVGFWSVQMVHGERYRELAENNRLRKKPLEPLRGVIYDRHDRVLAENVPSYNLLLDRSRTEDDEASLRFAAETLGLAPLELRRILQRYRNVPRFEPVLLVENLSLAEVARFGVADLEHPEFDIDIGHLRLYRHGLHTAHLLGYLREVPEEELKRPGTPYRGGDLVGRRGLEQRYDTLLRGEGGERQVVVDSRGRLVEESNLTPAAPGEDLRLTVDLGLQQEAQRLLEGQVGVILAMDPRDGAILAMASSPSYDPNLFSRRLEESRWAALQDAPHDPLQNRAVQNLYPPGSTFKVVVAAAGLMEGMTNPRERVFCNGSTTLYNHRYRCWKQAGHGWMNLEQALEHSCDVYFYHLGQRLGIERIADYARRFGLGSATGIDLEGEKDGLVPDLRWSLRVRRAPWYPGETVSVAIGQGALLTTPLQVARMIAVVANGGYLVHPHLVRGDAQEPKRVAVDPEVLQRIHRGLEAVVHSPEGTGRFAALPGVRMAGKTGTAQVVRQKGWIDSRDLPFNLRDHAWFAAYAPAEDPRLLIVVLSEHGGAGSRVAVPMAREMYARYFESTVGDHRTP